ncbi:MAG: glutamate formiminotransferase / 5-formyltetrahydrofolate cyclo-ligase [Solirubrobacterales bacterium]|jgi:glutamate formiminotransferase/glutamate formiminotransferase/formiminotetrahydrofolate cyclodeaminase|nr:glutamate formiminotransferase / 5-formyltetrahydrofolate cyclo-ligase [Solirubrobacterales bacterium]
MGGAEPKLLAVPNVSEGRDVATLEGVEAAFAAEAVVLDRHSDPIHNRTVFSLAPHGGRAAEALIGGARETIAAIDLPAHEGEHPRIGALDVAPVIYLSAASREEARAQALAAASGIAELGVPVFFYGEMASAAERRERAYFRSGGPAALAERMERGKLQPDMGPDAPHPTAGATLVTARPPLAAFNLEFEGMALTQAKAVAAALRESGGGLTGVRAIALPLRDDVTQISTNVHDPVAVPLGEVVARARELAEPHAGEIRAAEIVGLVPRAALDGFPDDILLPGFDRARGVIEDRLAELAGD